MRRQLHHDARRRGAPAGAHLFIALLGAALCVRLSQPGAWAQTRTVALGDTLVVDAGAYWEEVTVENGNVWSNLGLPVRGDAEGNSVFDTATTQPALYRVILRQ